MQLQINQLEIWNTCRHSHTINLIKTSTYYKAWLLSVRAKVHRRKHYHVYQCLMVKWYGWLVTNEEQTLSQSYIRPSPNSVVLQPIIILHWVCGSTIPHTYTHTHSYILHYWLACRVSGSSYWTQLKGKWVREDTPRRREVITVIGMIIKTTLTEWREERIDQQTVNACIGEKNSKMQSTT